jgi:hypothetical protein
VTFIANLAAAKTLVALALLAWDQRCSWWPISATQLESLNTLAKHNVELVKNCVSALEAAADASTSCSTLEQDSKKVLGAHLIGFSKILYNMWRPGHAKEIDLSERLPMLVVANVDNSKPADEFWTMFLSQDVWPAAQSAAAPLPPPLLGEDIFGDEDCSNFKLMVLPVQRCTQGEATSDSDNSEDNAGQHGRLQL